MKVAKVALVLLVLATVVVGWVEFADATGYPRALMIVLLVGNAAAVWTVISVLRGRKAQALCGGLLTALLIPTFFAYLPNLGLLLLVMSRMVIAIRRRQHTAM